MIIQPHWPAPPMVRAGTTTTLTSAHDLPSHPFHLLKQVHGNIVADAALCGQGETFVGDGLYTHQPHTICHVRTGDCLPLLICDRKGTQVAALHAGWRGLLAGIIPSGLNTFTVLRESLLIWLGPAIGPQAFEVGDEVRDAFITQDPIHRAAFKPSFKSGPTGYWFADIYQLARHQLIQQGISPDAIYGGEYCTYTSGDLFYSYRRDKATERMVSMIWLEP